MGGLVRRDDELAQRVRLLAHQGQARRERQQGVGCDEGLGAAQTPLRILK